MKPVVALLLALAGCASATAPSVKLSDGWPEKPESYDDAYSRWTRHAESSSDWVLLVDAYATLESPDFRAAQAAEWARRGKLPPAEAQSAADAERADAGEVWQVELLVATAHWEWNDFHKLGRSIWRVALVGDDGREVLPLSIKEDKRTRDAVRAWFPDMSPFHQAYIIRFPRTAADGKPLAREGSKLLLRLASPITGVELTWGG